MPNELLISIVVDPSHFASVWFPPDFHPVLMLSSLRLDTGLRLINSFAILIQLSLLTKGIILLLAEMADIEPNAARVLRYLNHQSNVVVD